MTLEAALRGFLIADNDVFGQTMNRVYVGEAPLNTDHPCAIVFQVGDDLVDPDISRTYEELLQITCRADTYAEASKLADTVKELLRAYSMRNTEWTDSDDTFHIIDSTYRGSRIFRADGKYDCPVDFSIKYSRA